MVREWAAASLRSDAGSPRCCTPHHHCQEVGADVAHVAYDGGHSIILLPPPPPPSPPVHILVVVVVVVVIPPPPTPLLLLLLCCPPCLVGAIVDIIIVGQSGGSSTTTISIQTTIPTKNISQVPILPYFYVLAKKECVFEHSFEVCLAFPRRSCKKGTKFLFFWNPGSCRF
jgi:hypothetical protein